MDNAPAVAPFVSVIVPTCHRNQDLTLCLEALRPARQNTLLRGFAHQPMTPRASGDPLDRNFPTKSLLPMTEARSTAEELVREKFPWARWLPGPRRGPAANRNSGAGTPAANGYFFSTTIAFPFQAGSEAYAAAIRNFPGIQRV